jgi:hypothetical protein
MNNQFATQYLLEEMDPYDLSDVNEESSAGGGNTVGGGTTDGASWDPQGPTGSGEQYAAGTRKKKYQEDAPRLAGDPSKTNKQGSKNLDAYSSVGFTKAPNAEEAGTKMKSIDVDMLWKEEVVGRDDINKDFIVVNKDGKKVEAIYKGVRRDGEHLFNTGYETIAINPKDLSTRVQSLKESRAYSKFKKEAATRSKDQQMHEAVRMIHNRLAEVSKILEYAQQMKAELSEGEQTLEYNHNTKKMFERINSKVVEIYSKTRQLK